MDTGMIVLMILVAMALLISSPLATIWALNTLFPALGIPYSWVTWLAMVVLMLCAGLFKIKS